MSATKYVRVVGVSFAKGYPQNLLTLGRIAADLNLTAGELEVEFVRNPTNPHDANAVAVHVPELPEGLTMIGHVDRDNAARLAPLLDRGVRFTTWVDEIRVDQRCPNRPGITIGVKRAVPAEVR